MNPNSLLLQGFDVVRQISYPEMHFGLVLVAYGHEHGTPDRHFLGAVGRNATFAGDGLGNLHRGKLSRVLSGKNSEICRRRLKRGRNGSITLSFLSVAGGAINFEHLLT